MKKSDQQRKIKAWLRLPRTSREFFDRGAYLLLTVVTLLIVAPFFIILFDVIVRGVGGLSPALIFENVRDLGYSGGVRNAIIGTLHLVMIASVVAIPLSVGAAVFTTEYSKGGRIQQMVELTADVLAGVPSIVFGAFGYLFFVWILRWETSLIAGALTLSLMMIPTVLRTTQEALRAVPVTIREASLALGATRWSTTWRVTLRACIPAIITGVLLAIGRIAGETAPLIFTTGYNLNAPWSIFEPVASLPFTIYMFTMHWDPIINQKAYATSLVLIVFVLAVDVVANWISRRVGILVRKE